MARRGAYDVGTISKTCTQATTPASGSSFASWSGGLMSRRCVRSVSASRQKHAAFMAQRGFNAEGIKAAVRTRCADTPSDDRAEALRRLREGQIRIIFAVDLFNEGLDIPYIDTVLFLRPTESATVFLQQLGRGLRHAPDKACLTGARPHRPPPQGVPLRPTLPGDDRQHPRRARA